MALEIKQGVGETLQLTMPFDPSILGYFSVDLFQQGQVVASKDSTECLLDDRTIMAAFTDDETARLSPQRVSLNFRGVYADGGQVIIEDIPVTVRRSQYRGTADCGASCVGMCTTGCFDSCTGTCSDTCTGTCSDSCTGNCSGGCSGMCTIACAATCVSACGLNCASSCTGCSGTCSSTCLTACAVASAGPSSVPNPPPPSSDPGSNSGGVST